MSSDKPTQPAAQFNQSGSKYLRPITHLLNNGCADVYAVLIAFAVTCPARQHAIKKLLCSGIRGKGDTLQDLREARDAIDRAIQIQDPLHVSDSIAEIEELKRLLRIAIPFVQPDYHHACDGISSMATIDRMKRAVGLPIEDSN